MKWANENAYDSIVSAAAVQYGVDPSLIKAIIAQESRFNPKAFRAEPGGLVGSFGLMQLLPSTAAAFGFSGDNSLLYDPWSNILAGTAYLKSCLRRTGGNVAAAASMYNGGYRPSLGFGAPVTQTTTVTLAKDANGKPTKTFTAQPGQFGNQDYVNNVLDYQTYFMQTASLGQAPASSPQAGSAPVAMVGGTVVVTVLLIGAVLFLLKPR